MIMALSINSQAQDPIIEAVKAATKKIIRAVDLQVQRLQNNTIDLQNVQKQLENILSKLKLEEIADWTNRQKELYQEYFDELWRVKSILAYYRLFSDIVGKQKQLFLEYKQAYTLVTDDPFFSDNERDFIYGIYSNILSASIQNIDDIVTIMQSFSVQMSDADRLETINKANDALDEQLTALRDFNQRNNLLSKQRAQSMQQLEKLRRLYGIQ